MRFAHGICLALLAFNTAISATAQKGYSTHVSPLDSPGISSKVQFKLATGDFNFDGKADIFAYGDIPASDSHVIGSGAVIPVKGTTQYVQTGDLNGDGVLDMAVCSVDPTTGQWTLTTLINVQRGHFTVGFSAPLPFTCTSVNILDAVHSATGPEALEDDVMVTGYTGTGPYNNIVATFYGDATGKLARSSTLQNVNLDSSSSPMTSNCMLIDALQGVFKGATNAGRHYVNSFIFNTACSPASGPANQYGTTFLASGYGEVFSFSELRSGKGILTGGKSVHDGKSLPVDSAVFISTDGSGTSKLTYARNDDYSNGYSAGHLTFFDITSALPSGAPVTQVSGVTSMADLNHDGYQDLAVTYMTGTATSGNAYVSILQSDNSAMYRESQHWLVGDATSTLLGTIVSADFDGDGRPSLATTYQNPVNGKVFLLLYQNTPGSDSCAVPETPRTSIICDATGNVRDGFNFTAASNVPGFTVSHILLDGYNIFSSYAQSILGAGYVGARQHTLTMVSEDNSGGSISTSTGLYISPYPPVPQCSQATPGVRICAPLTSSVDSALTISARAVAENAGISAIRIYSDGVAVGTFSNPVPSSSFYLNVPILIEPGPHTLTLVAYETGGGSSTADVSVVVTGQKGCAVASVPLNICGLAADSTVQGTFVIGAGASSPTAGITGIRAYIDDEEAFFVPSISNAPAFETQREVSAGPGRHHLVVVAYQGSEAAITKDEFFTVAGTTVQPCYPSAAGAIICSPSADATFASPAQVVAGATVTDGYLTAIRVYVDDVPQLTLTNPHRSRSFQIDESLTIATGTHSVVVVGYSSNGTAVTASESVTVVETTPQPTIPPLMTRQVEADALQRGNSSIYRSLLEPTAIIRYEAQGENPQTPVPDMNQVLSTQVVDAIHSKALDRIVQGGKAYVLRLEQERFKLLPQMDFTQMERINDEAMFQNLKADAFRPYPDFNTYGDALKIGNGKQSIYTAFYSYISNFSVRLVTGQPK